MLAEAFEASLAVIRVLESLRVDYLVGGSLASSLHGVPRSGRCRGCAMSVSQCLKKDGSAVTRDRLGCLFKHNRARGLISCSKRFSHADFPNPRPDVCL